MRRGDVYWADLTPRSGSEQTGRRPVVIVSHNGFNETPGWLSIIVVPLSTSTSHAKRGLTVVPLPAGVAGLPQASVALCHQVTTLDRRKLVEHIGSLPPTSMKAIEAALRASLDLEDLR